MIAGVRSTTFAVWVRSETLERLELSALASASPLGSESASCHMPSEVSVQNLTRSTLLVGVSFVQYSLRNSCLLTWKNKVNMTTSSRTRRGIFFLSERYIAAQMTIIDANDPSHPEE